MKRALLLTAATVALWVVAAAAVSLWKDGPFPPTAIVSGLAMLVALVPALLALSLHGLARHGPPEVELVSLLLGVGLRLALTMVLAVMMDRTKLPQQLVQAVQSAPPAAVPGGQPPGNEVYHGPSNFLIWVLGFYLATLAFSTILYSVSPTWARTPSFQPDEHGAQ